MNENLGAKRRKDHACGTIEPVIHSLNDNVLLVDGVWFDDVASVSEPLTQADFAGIASSEGGSTVLLDMWETIANERELYPTGVPMIDAFYKTLICGREEGDRHAENFVAFWKSLQAPDIDLATFCIITPEIVQLMCQRSSTAHLLAQMHEQHHTERSSAHLDIDRLFSQSPRSVSPIRGNLPFSAKVKASNDQPSRASSRAPLKHHKRTLSGHLRNASDRRFRDLLKTSATNRVLFTTDRGYIGLGVVGTQEGDVVSVLSGGKVPLVLRRSEITDRRHLDRKPPRSRNAPQLKSYSLVAEVVGEAYVHGIMKGEAVKNGAKWERIALV